MKLETCLIFTKGTIKLMVGTLTPLGAVLATLAATGKPITKMDVAIASIGAAVGGCNALDGWLSSSFGNFLKQFNLNGNGNGKQVPPVEMADKPKE
jgi:hypothetical protein